MKITIIGGGSFGTALANVLSTKLNVVLLVRKTEICSEINDKNINTQYFPNILLNKNLSASTDYGIINNSEIIIFAIPSKFVIEEFNKARTFINKEAIIINTAKGFSSSGETILNELKKYHLNCFSLLGPTFANNLIKNEYSAFTVASDNKKDFELAKSIFSDTNILLDYSTNFRLIEMASILKNVFAIAIGLYDSIGDSVNTKYVFLNQAFKEMNKILNTMFTEGIGDNYLKYAVFGDLLLTSLNDQSRNKTLGQLIGRGFYNPSEKQSKITFEGIRSTASMLEFANKHKLSVPIISFTQNILNGSNAYKEFNECMKKIQFHSENK